MPSNSLFIVFFFKTIFIFQLVYLDFFLFGYILYFLFASEGEFFLMILMSTHLRIRMIGTSLGFFWALVEFEGWMFSYLENLMGLNCIGEGMWKGRKDKGDRCNLQSNICQVEVLHPHLTINMCLSHPLNHRSRRGHICPLWDSMAPEIIHLLEFSMKLLRKIRGKNSISKVSDLFFL